jgi:murein DD-endopeptidase MepM/ murein hydrolase activator NlpD
MKKLLLVIVLLITAVIVYLFSSSEVTANIDSHIYELPFKPGTSQKIVQGYGGRFSHNHKAALDFRMPEGTPVYAAREGLIYRYKDDSNEGGPFPCYEKKANFIIIKHDDGTFGCYWHLKEKGVVVKEGKVAEGQLIGYSGGTGFVLRPHLHFSVKRILNYEENSFVRTKFRTVQGIELLESGKMYERPLLKSATP